MERNGKIKVINCVFEFEENEYSHVTRKQKEINIFFTFMFFHQKETMGKKITYVYFFHLLFFNPPKSKQIVTYLNSVPLLVSATYRGPP